MTLNTSEENNKSVTVLADLTVACDSLLYGTDSQIPITAFDLLLLLIDQILRTGKK